MLYTLNKSPYTTNSLESVLDIAPAGAPLLLYEDGVYAAVPSPKIQALADKALADHPVYALGPDLKARGLEEVWDGIRIIGYDGFVSLVEEHHVVPWL
jgi:tRNA 2-thiouridine synthesizing protein B